MNRSLSVRLVSPTYVVFLTSFAFYDINQVRRFSRHLLFEFSHFSCVVKCVICFFIIDAWASETSMFGVAAESAKRMVRLSVGCWVLKFLKFLPPLKLSKYG